MTSQPLTADRINARLDPSRIEKLEYLKRATGLGVTEIVKRGIDALFEAEQGRSSDPGAVLAAHGFIGAAEGPEDLSIRYKEDLRSILEAKGDPG